jgi:DNA-binding response OmpR family regulator
VEPNKTVAKILVVDDEDDVRSLIAFTLDAQGFETVQACNGMEAFEQLALADFDLVVLDVMMPVITGLDVLQRIREGGRTPVILLTALASVENRVRGLELGADDYLTKPFDVVELAARVHAVLRRTRGGTVTDEVIRLNGLDIDRASREVFVGGAVVETTAKEFDLLCYLASSPGRVFTRHQLLLDVWDSSAEWQQEGTVTEHVRRLRNKIEDDPDNPRWLQTVRGVGYRFERRSKERIDAEDRAWQDEVAAKTAALRELRELLAR